MFKEVISKFDVIASARDGMWEERSNPQNWEIASPHRTNPRWCSQRRFIILRKSSSYPTTNPTLYLIGQSQRAKIF